MIYRFRGCEVVVDERSRYVETRFPDGTKVGSTPNRDDDSLRLAASLGYGDDTWAMSRDHEIAHAWLAHLRGADRSPTMWRLAHPEGEVISDDEVREEEAEVLELQGALDKAAIRPWDHGDEVERDDRVPW